MKRKVISVFMTGPYGTGGVQIEALDCTLDAAATEFLDVRVTANTVIPATSDYLSLQRTIELMWQAHGANVIAISHNVTGNGTPDQRSPTLATRLGQYFTGIPVLKADVPMSEKSPAPQLILSAC